MVNLVTPVRVNELRKLQLESKYDKEKTAFLVDGFTNGFNLEYDGPRNIRQESTNLKLNNEEEKIILWNKVMKEVKLKRYAGPFERPPFDFYVQSPIGLVPKDEMDHRLIFHLSYPRNSRKSIYENTDPSKCKVVYPDFCKAILLCAAAGKACKISKSDFKSAFRNLCIRRQDWAWLVMRATSHIDGKDYYFVDKCLPFGASISCAHFQAFSDAISHIMKYKTGKDNVNYLDDFLFVTLLTAMCNAQIDTFLRICSLINFPVSLDKMFWACT